MNQIEQDIEVPPYFLCPISLQIMKDPVTVSTGITYERENIEKWVFLNKNTSCPVTKQDINTEFFTPNHTLRRLIQSWCTLHASSGIERFPTPKPPATHSQIMKLIRDADRNPDIQTKAKCLKKLRSIASYSTANRRCLESAGAVEFLSRVIVQDSVSLDQDMSACDEALGILSQLKVSNEERLKKLMEQTEGAGALFDSLSRVMSRSNFECRAHAVQLMKGLIQVAEPAQAAALKVDHLTEVVQLIKDQVSPRATRAALKVLALACPWGRNRVRAVEAGVVPVLVDLLMEGEDKRSSEMAMAVLDQVCGCAEGRAELLAHGAGIAVVSKKILRVSHFASERGVRILASIAKFSGSTGVLQEMVQLGVVTKLCLVLQVDCDAKTKERARETLRLHAKTWRSSPCAPHHVLSSFS